MKISRREFSIGLSGAMAAPVVPTVMAKTVAAPFDVTPFVHPDLRAAAEQLKAFRTGGDITGASLEGARKGQSAYVLPPLEAPAYREAIIPGPRGNPNLRPRALHVSGSHPSVKCLSTNSTSRASEIAPNPRRTALAKETAELDETE